MAPKRALKKAHGADAKPKANAKQDARTAEATLAAAADASASAGRRRLSRRQTDSQVERAIADHFGDFTPYQVDLLRQQGKTLRECLSQDIHAKNVAGKTTRLGSSYWADLRSLYSTSDATSASMTDPFRLDDDECNLSLALALIAAMTAAKNPNTTKMSKGLLQCFMCSVTALNMRELVGICRHMVMRRGPSMLATGGCMDV